MSENTQEKPEKPLLFKLDDLLKQYAKKWKKVATKPGEPPRAIPEAPARPQQSPSNPHGLSFRDAPDRGDGLRVGKG